MNFIGTWEGTCKQFTKIGDNFKGSKYVYTKCTKKGAVESFKSQFVVHYQKDDVIKGNYIDVKKPNHESNDVVGMITDSGKCVTLVNYCGTAKMNVIDNNTIELIFFNVEFKEFQILSHVIYKRVK
jgi:hypothetical protein